MAVVGVSAFGFISVRFFVVVAVSFYEEPKWKRLTSDVETFSTQQKQQLRLLQQPRPRESSDETATHLLTHTYEYATHACMCAKAYDQLQQQQQQLRQTHRHYRLLLLYVAACCCF